MLKNKNFVRIYSFFVVFLLAVSVGRGFLVLWFQENGFTYSQIAGYFLIKLIFPSILIPFIKRYSVPKTLIFALLSEVLLMLSVYHFFYSFQIYLLGLFSGTTVVLFYITYNILYFENTPKIKRAFSASLFALAGPILGISLPLIMGFYIAKWGFASIFLFAVGILVVDMWMIRFLPKIKIKSNLKKILVRTKQVNFLLVIEGIRESVNLAAIPLFTLFFINSPLPFGIFFSYLGLVSGAATVLLGYLSDRFKRRKEILYSTSILTALMIILLGFSNNLTQWAVLTGLFGLVTGINGTFVTTLVLDKIRKVNDGMISREFLLGVGRGVGTMIILVSLFFSDSIQFPLFAIGGVYLLFPLMIYVKKIYD